MKFRSPKLDIHEKLNRKIETETIRRLQIDNSLRRFYGFGLPIIFLVLILAVITLVCLHGLGIMCLTSVVAWIIVQAFVACATSICVVARRIF
jgi:hypothetical protein